MVELSTSSFNRFASVLPYSDLCLKLAAPNLGVTIAGVL